ncbi:MAG: DUF2341 domain-containing protein [bacterium]|nr:DUF2341 domain-containing protein [bacterium]
MRISKKLGEAVRVALVFILISSWVFSAWPQVFRMPPKVEKAEAGGWYDAAWQYRQKITIDTSKVAGAATSFPVLVNRTDTALKSTDWGGHMGTATGAEILFTAGDGTTKLDHETEKFASTTGELVAWVRMPFLSSTSTNELYMYYGNASQADQQNKTAVWDEFYKGVWHLTTTSGPTTITYDSTVNLNTGTKLTATEPVDAT